MPVRVSPYPPSPILLPSGHLDRSTAVEAGLLERLKSQLTSQISAAASAHLQTRTCSLPRTSRCSRRESSLWQAQSSSCDTIHSSRRGTASAAMCTGLRTFGTTTVSYSSSSASRRPLVPCLGLRMRRAWAGVGRCRLWVLCMQCRYCSAWDEMSPPQRR